jgi:dienelactone hydrolase
MRRRTVIAAALGVLAVALAACDSAVTQTTPTTPSARSGFITNGDVRLAYEIDLPAGNGPFPAVVAGHGSGLITRHNLRFLSDRWTAMGFATLRFDKRGVGDSTGTYANVGTANSAAMFPVLASDIAAAVRFLRTQPQIDPRRVGLTGNSQAGWILPLAARELGDAAFMVILAGPVCSVGLEIYYSNIVENSTRPLEEAYSLLPAFTGNPGFDPMPVLQEIDTPALWLLGEDDRSIPVRTSVHNLNTLTAGGKPYEWRTYPGLGHSLGSVIWNDVGAWADRFRR